MSNRRNRRSHRYARPRVVALALAALLGLAACSGSDGDGGSSSGASEGAVDTQESSAREDADAARDGVDMNGGKTTTSGGLTEISLQDRAIERRGSLVLASNEVGAARDAVIADADRLGGYVADEQSSTDDDGDLAHVRLELVVPTDEFDEAMTASADAGEIVSREQSARDVTEKVVDVNSRVENAKASLHRIRLLLGRAEKLGDVIRLESVLGEREADLESLQARQKSLQQRTTTATIGVSIRPKETAEPTKEDEDDSGFLAGLDAGWSGLQTAWTAVATVAGAILPFVLVLGIPVVLVALLVRRMLRRRVAGTAAGAGATEVSP